MCVRECVCVNDTRVCACACVSKLSHAAQLNPQVFPAPSQPEGAKLEPSQSQTNPTWNPEMPMNEAKTKAQARVQIP